MGRAVGHGLGWLEFFEELPDPRQKAKVLYPLPELLRCCLVGVLCGAEGWVEVEEYCAAKLDFLRRFLPFAHGIASHDTFSDVVDALDATRFKVAFIAWAAALQGGGIAREHPRDRRGQACPGAGRGQDAAALLRPRAEPGADPYDLGLGIRAAPGAGPARGRRQGE